MMGFSHLGFACAICFGLARPGMPGFLRAIRFGFLRPRSRAGQAGITVAVAATVALVAGCAAPPPLSSPSPASPSKTTVTTTGGGYYGGDRPPTHWPLDPDTVADAVPRVEPLSATGNRPYIALGKRYQPLATAAGYVARGHASWYGSKFHGRRTSSGEAYDMFAMTAAHPVLPLPTFVRVTNLDNGRAVVVRVNDRGPFLHGRIIDLSYIAAHKLGIAARGTGRVEVRALMPADGAAAATVDGAGPATVDTAGPATVDTAATVDDGVSVAAGEVTTAAATPAQKYLLQVGAYTTPANAMRMREKLESAGYPVAIKPHTAATTDSTVTTTEATSANSTATAGTTTTASTATANAHPLYRVRVGPFKTPAAAQSIRQKLEQLLDTPVALITE